MRNTALRTLPVLFMLLFSFTGCKKKDKVKPDRPPETNFILVNDSGTPGDLIQVKTDGRFEADSVNISVGETPVALYRINDTVAVFRLPVLPAGKVNIDLSAVSGKPASFTVSQYTPITDPGAVRQEFAANIQQSVEAADTMEDKTLLPVLKGLQEVFLSEYEKLTEKDKAEVAYTLQKLNKTDLGIARKGALSMAQQAAMLRGTASDPEAFIDKGKRFVMAIAGVAIAIEGGTALKHATDIKSKVIGVALIAGGVALMIKAVDTENELFDLISEQFKFDLFDRSASESRKAPADTSLQALARDYDMVFSPGEPVARKIRGYYRSFSQANLNQSPFYKEVFTAVYQFAFVNGLIRSGVETIRGWGGIFASTIPAFPSYAVAIPESPLTDTWFVPAADLLVENVSDPDINLKATADGEEWMLTATATNVEETREFSFDIVYRHEELGIENKMKVQAVYYGDGVPPESVVVSTEDNVPAKISGLSQSIQLEAKVLPVDAKQEVGWSIVSGAEHAIVNAAGKVTSISEGTVTVRAAAKADASIYDDMEISIADYKYSLQIGDYNPDYDQITPQQTIEDGASISLPNYMKQMVRLMLNGEPVNVGQYGLPWTGVTFGNVPASAEAVHLPDYAFTLYDAANGRYVTFHLDLTLTNEAYANLIGKPLKIWGGNLIVTFKSDGTYSSVWKDSGESGGSGTYRWEGDIISPSHVPCGESFITTPVIGAIYTNGAGSLTFPSYILMEKGGTFRANSGYGCPESYNYISIE